METVGDFTYCGDRVSVVGGCEAAVTARIKCGLVEFRECCGLLYGRRLPMKLKGAVYESYVIAGILHGSEAWCLKESVIKIL